VFSFAIQIRARTALAAAFCRRLLLRQFTWLVWPENGRYQLPLAVAVQVVYTKARGGNRNHCDQQVNEDMSDLLFQFISKTLQK